MQKKHLLASLLVAAAASSSWLFSDYLTSTDTTLGGYLSGVISQTVGSTNGKLIRVNLHNSSISLYENGIPVKQSKIAGAGNPWDYTNTPVGEYDVLSKEQVHVSRLSGVLMPLAMRFYQGYYFHSIPLTPDGVPITTKYSHGCIRLSNELSAEVFKWTTVGTHVIVYRSALVRAEGSPTVYQLSEDGVRRAVATLDAFYRNGFSFNDVAVVPWGDIAQLPLGIAIE